MWITCLQLVDKYGSNSFSTTPKDITFIPSCFFIKLKRQLREVKKVLVDRTGIKSSLIRILYELMYLFNLFKPQCMVSEKIFFRFDHHLYVVKYYSGYEEMWAESVYDGGHSHYLLGTIKQGEWYRPKEFRVLKWNMQTKAAPRLFKEYQRAKIEGMRDDKTYYQKAKEQQKNLQTPYTKEDFVRWGKMGQAKVRLKYGKGSGAIGWAKKKKLSTDK